MTSRVVLVHAEPELPRRPRNLARDGWRVFHSAATGFEIAIPAYQVARIEAIAKRERSEWYALAVGELCRDDHGTHAVVRDFVPNDWAERGRAHVHIGAAAEAQVRELARELHPTLHPLGNLHTHQRFTTRPSGTDRQEFWNDPNSVSIILDPFDRPTIAVYRGRDGERLVELADGPAPEPPKPAAPMVQPRPRAALPVIPPPLLALPSVAAQAERLGLRMLLGALVFSVVLVGSFAVLGYLTERRMTEVAASSEALLERVAVLEAQAAMAPVVEPVPVSDDDLILECTVPER